MTDALWADYRPPAVLDFIPVESLTTPEQISSCAQMLFDGLQREKVRMAHLDKWMRGEQDLIIPYKDPDREVKELLALGRNPLLGSIVSVVTQALIVDGYKSPTRGKRTVEGPWKTWNANGMPSRQSAVYRAAIGYGYSYVLTSKGVSPYTGEAQSVMRGLSPKRCLAVFDDPSFDDYPQYAIIVEGADKNGTLCSLFDSRMVHKVQLRDDGRWLILSSDFHGASDVPIVRYVDQMDLDGYTPGMVEPYIGLAKRVDKTMFDRLLVQHFNSWKKLWMAGVPSETTDEDAEKIKTRLRHDDALVAEDPETKFGAIPETSLEGFITAIESDIANLSANAQMPPDLFGPIQNLSADAIDLANRKFLKKVFERQQSFTQSNNQLMRLSASLEGDEEAAQDVMASVSWQDMDVRSIAQAADAYGKIVAQLGVPKRATWSKLPGVDQLDVDEWVEMAQSDDPVDVMLRNLDNKATARTGVSGADPSIPTSGVDKNPLGKV